MAGIVFHSMAESAYLWTAMLAAREKGVPYELTPLTYRSPEHLKLHPFGKMPVMQHGDAYLYETAAIAHYIDKAFDGPALQPPDALGQANTIRWIGIVNSYVFPVMNRFMKERLVKPLWGAAPDNEFLDSAPEQLALQMRLIDEAVSDGGYLVGGELTLADCFLLPDLLFYGITDEGRDHLKQFKNARAWLGRMMARPSFAQTPMPQAHAAMSTMSRRQPG
jgi:glutathione S-transferase